VSSFDDATAMKVPENVAKHSFNSRAPLCAGCLKPQRNVGTAHRES
jgi:hypothetical protein